ncbi:hypothetical protein ColTof4_10682 [Colletotrichum tofieldiae]|nr:hypothetical protein ColTof3_06802 [Colletotrichum tofieldiae]GKT78259.1 hypothetical protein ColTof4_10682 [Colletotrichum tofieldiae]
MAVKLPAMQRQSEPGFTVRRSVGIELSMHLNPHVFSPHIRERSHDTAENGYDEEAMGSAAVDTNLLDLSPQASNRVETRMLPDMPFDESFKGYQPE